MKKSNVIGLIFVILVFFIIVSNVLFKYQERLNEYRRPIRIHLSRIHESLVNYYKLNKQLPHTLDDLFKGKDKEYIDMILESPVNDEFDFFSKGKRYYLPFLYDDGLRKTYENSPSNYIIVASPRFNNRRYVLLLKDVINYKSDQYKTRSDAITVMRENGFQKQVKKQNWQIPPQSPDNRIKRKRIGITDYWENKKRESPVIY